MDRDRLKDGGDQEFKNDWWVCRQIGAEGGFCGTVHGRGAGIRSPRSVGAEMSGKGMVRENRW